MASFGYYAATVSYAIDEGQKPVKVTVTIAPGPLYHLADYAILGSNPALSDGRIRITANRLGVDRGDPAAAAAVVESQARLLSTLARQSFPLAKVLDRKVVVDHATRTMSVTMRIDTGPSATFGPLTMAGLETVDPDYIRLLLPWQEGDPFNAAKVEAGRQAVVATGLFTTVRIAHADAVGPDGSLPISLTVTEGKHRSVGGGLRYTTGEGFSARAFWEHHNLLGGGEHLTVNLIGGQSGYGLDSTLRSPAFLEDAANTLLLNAKAEQQYLDAFDATTIGISAGVERALTRKLSVNAGLSLEYSRIKDNNNDADDETKDFTLLGLPLGLHWDTSDDLFDPHEGNRLQIEATPYTAVAGPSSSFVVTRIYDSFYIPLGGGFTSASWGRVGSIFGASADEIPADKLLYGGGGGSVRAYAFQKLGPLDDDGDPTGGRSLVELGTELRYRISEQFGAVAFLEGGNVYPDSIPDFSDSLLWGAGVGVRYFTDFGPIRLDVAMPLDRRSDDDLFQLYVSIGQAF
jgi:translocation and assembly module TamA